MITMLSEPDEVPPADMCWGGKPKNNVVFDLCLISIKKLCFSYLILGHFNILSLNSLYHGFIISNNVAI